MKSNKDKPKKRKLTINIFTRLFEDQKNIPQTTHFNNLYSKLDEEGQKRFFLENKMSFVPGKERDWIDDYLQPVEIYKRTSVDQPNQSTPTKYDSNSPLIKNNSPENLHFFNDYARYQILDNSAASRSLLIPSPDRKHYEEYISPIRRRSPTQPHSQTKGIIKPKIKNVYAKLFEAQSESPYLTTDNSQYHRLDKDSQVRFYAQNNMRSPKTSVQEDWIEDYLQQPVMQMEATNSYDYKDRENACTSNGKRKAIGETLIGKKTKNVKGKYYQPLNLGSQEDLNNNQQLFDD
ncbi:unnamed protein product [Gordionus sp. m RMFG-2023]